MEAVTASTFGFAVVVVRTVVEAILLEALPG